MFLIMVLQCQKIFQILQKQKASKIEFSIQEILTRIFITSYIDVRFLLQSSHLFEIQSNGF